MNSYSFMFCFCRLPQKMIIRIIIILIASRVSRTLQHGEEGSERQNYPEEAMKMIFMSHMGLHDGMDRTGYKGAFIPGLDIVIPPLQPRGQIEGMLAVSPLVRGSRKWDGGVEGEGRNTTLFFAGSVKPLKPRMDCPPRSEGLSCNVRKAVIAQWGDREGFHLYNHSTPDYHKVGWNFPCCWCLTPSNLLLQNMMRRDATPTHVHVTSRLTRVALVARVTKLTQLTLVTLVSQNPPSSIHVVSSSFRDPTTRRWRSLTFVWA